MTVITNIEDLRVLAQKRVPRMFYDYADSGSWTESTYRANEADFRNILLRQRVAVNMENRSTASTMIGQSAPGNTLKMDIWRRGAAKELTAKLGSAEAKTAEAAGPDEAVAQGKLGLALRPLQLDEQRETGVKNGLMVQQASGAAAQAGLRQGDVLVSINGVPVSDIDQVRAVVAKSDKSVALLIQRGDNRIFVPVTLG